jgi:hypothetical protein
MQAWFNIHKLLNITQHINRSKDKNYKITSTEKDVNKIPQNFLIKVLMKLGLKGMYLDTIKAIYDNILNIYIYCL